MKHQTTTCLALLVFVLLACTKEQKDSVMLNNRLMLRIGGENASLKLDSITSPQLDSTSAITRKYRFDLYPDSSGTFELEFIQTKVEDTIDGVYSLVKTLVVKSSGEIATTFGSFKIIQSINAKGDSASRITEWSNEPVFSDIIDVENREINYPKPILKNTTLFIDEQNWKQHQNQGFPSFRNAYLFHHMQIKDSDPLFSTYSFSVNDYYLPLWRGEEHKYLVFRWPENDSSSVNYLYGWAEISLTEFNDFVVHKVIYQVI